MIGAESIAEFNAFVFREILFEDEVFGDVPIFDGGREDEFCFNFAGMSSTEFVVAPADVEGMADDFF